MLNDFKNDFFKIKKGGWLKGGKKGYHPPI
jgi:hypothetical protein